MTDNMKRNYISAVLIVFIIFLSIFGTFAPVSEKMAYWAMVAAFFMGIAAVLLDMKGFIEEKRKKAVYNHIVVIAASTGLFLFSEKTDAIIILCAFAIAVVAGRYADSKERISQFRLEKMLPQKARIVAGGREIIIDSGSLEPGAIVQVNGGERVPSDGIIIRGAGIIDDQLIVSVKGHSRKVARGDFVPGGSVNMGGPLHIEIVEKSSKCYMAGNAEIVKWSLASSGKAEKVIGRLNIAVSSLLIVSSVAMFIISTGVMGNDIEVWLIRAMMIVLASTAGMPERIYRDSISRFIVKNIPEGVFFRDRDSVADISKCRFMMIEKDLTTGQREYRLSHIVSEDVPKEEILFYAAHMEYYSDHVLARLIYDGFMQVAKYEGLSKSEAMKLEMVSGVEEIEGKGVTGKLGDNFVCVGNRELMKLINLKKLPEEDDMELIYVAVNQKYLGYIAVECIAKDGEEDFFSSWAEGKIDRFAVFDDSTYEEVRQELNKDRKKSDRTGTLFRAGTKSRNVKGAEYAVVIDALGKKNIIANVIISHNSISEVADVKTKSATAVRNATVVTSLFIILKVVFYIGAFCMIIPVWMPFTAEILLGLLLRNPFDDPWSDFYDKSWDDEERAEKEIKEKEELEKEIEKIEKKAAEEETEDII